MNKFEKNHISAFDLDHTLLSINSSYQFGYYLYKKNVFSTSKLCYLLTKYFFHKLNILSINQLHQVTFNTIFLNQNSCKINELAEDFIDEFLNSYYYKPALEKLSEAKENNHFTLLLSSSPCFLVKIIAKKLQFDDWLATTYASNSSGNFSNIANILLGKDKAIYLENKRTLLGIPVSQTYAYSDSYLDIDFLKSAGKAICVKPDKKLKHISVKNNWEII